MRANLKDCSAWLDGINPPLTLRLPLIRVTVPLAPQFVLDVYIELMRPNDSFARDKWFKSLSHACPRHTIINEPIYRT